jgi:hypothetical protein
VAAALTIAERALTAVAYDAERIAGLARMRKVLARCPRDGLLYRTQP